MKAASTVELRRLNTGSRASIESTPPCPCPWPCPPFCEQEDDEEDAEEEDISDGEGGGGVVIGERWWWWPPSMGLAGGDAGKLKAPWPTPLPLPEPDDDVGGNVGLPCSGKKLAIEVVGDSDSDPMGEARSEPVDIDRAGLRGS